LKMFYTHLDGSKKVTWANICRVLVYCGIGREDRCGAKGIHVPICKGRH